MESTPSTGAAGSQPSSSGQLEPSPEAHHQLLQPAIFPHLASLGPPFANWQADVTRARVAALQVASNPILAQASASQTAPSSPTVHAASNPRPRWKPNAGQIALLEAHFGAGHTKPTTELVAAVQIAGEASETQATTDHGQQESSVMSLATQSGSGEQAADTDLQSTKRQRTEEVAEAAQPADSQAAAAPVFASAVSATVAEVQQILQQVDPADAALLQEKILSAPRVICYGVGREGLAMKAFAMRLFHLGVQAHAAFEMTTPPLRRGDLFLVSAGPSFFHTVAAMAGIAIKEGATVVAFTYHRTAPLTFANHIIRVCAPLEPPEMPHSGMRAAAAPASTLLLGSAYEACLHLLLDIVAVMLAAHRRVSDTDLRQAHTNLE